MDRAARLIEAACFAVGLAIAGAVAARDLAAGPSDYRDAVRSLRPGDTLVLAPGTYAAGLDVRDVVGTPEAPIVIRGAAGTARSRFTATAGRNTVRIVDSAYVTLADLDLIGSGAPVDAIKAERTARYAHHITIEGMRISGYGISQQNVAISTKCPTWDWIIRNNVIVGAGTGMYLGDSDGTAPFVRGTIEHNVIVGTIGYNLQIKHQIGRPAGDMFDGDLATVIRYNAFSKDARSSVGEGARPNVLIGHLPLVGRGSRDRYLVYGNIFVDNPGEFLIQAEGNVILYNNVFVNRCAGAVAIREHHDVPREVEVFHNTILARTEGVLLRHGNQRFSQRVLGNAIFARSPVAPDRARDNVVGSLEDAARYLKSPSASLLALDLTPRHGLLDTPLADIAMRSELPDASLDVDGVIRSAPVAGAYAGESSPDRRRFRAIAAVALRRSRSATADAFACGAE